MSDLCVRIDDLAGTGTALQFLAGELRGAERIVEDNRSAVGHPLLARRLDDFQGNWDDRRNDMLDSIDALAETARGAAEGFADIEQGLVSALEGRV